MDNLSTKDTILLVDDEQVVLDVTTLQIKKLGYKALQATNGAEASQIFSDNKETICLVILDMKLPDEPGSETCKRLKEIEPDVKVLHVSGLGRSQAGRSLECGCDRFLIKPFKIDQLSNSIKYLLENAQRSQSGAMNRPVCPEVIRGELAHRGSLCSE
jgi:two-component system cell cycle sensor histidine kinase/response regulator CckA